MKKLLYWAHISVFSVSILFIITPAYSERISLKSGKVIEGKIVERNDRFVKVDRGIGVNSTYYFDEIETISGQELEDQKNSQLKVGAAKTALPFKTAIIKYSLTISGSMRPLTKGHEIVYIDTFKNKITQDTSTITFVGDQQVNNHKLIIYDGKLKLDIDLNKKNVFAVNTQGSITSIFDEQNFLEMKYPSRKVLFLGKECNLYEVDGNKWYFWNGILLKEEIVTDPSTNLANVQYNSSKEATDIQLDVLIPPEKFEIPDGMEIKDLDNKRQKDSTKVWIQRKEVGPLTESIVKKQGKYLLGISSQYQQDPSRITIWITMNSNGTIGDIDAAETLVDLVTKDVLASFPSADGKVRLEAAKKGDLFWTQIEYYFKHGRTTGKSILPPREYIDELMHQRNEPPQVKYGLTEKQQRQVVSEYHEYELEVAKIFKDEQAKYFAKKISNKQASDNILLFSKQSIERLTKKYSITFDELYRIIGQAEIKGWNDVQGAGKTTLTLKTGQKVTGEIVEQTDEFIKLKVDDRVLLYHKYNIEKIEDLEDIRGEGNIGDSDENGEKINHKASEGKSDAKLDLSGKTTKNLSQAMPVLSPQRKLGKSIVTLKSGQKVVGEIVEQTDEYIKLNFNDVTLTYYKDRIEKIE